MYASWQRGAGVAPAIACTLLVLLTTSLPADDLKWRAPRISAASQTIPPPPGIAQAVEPLPEPFRAPPLELPPVEPSLSPSVLPPEVIEQSAPTDSWDPLGYFFEHADDTLPAIEEWERNTPPLVTYLTPTKPGVFQKFGLSGTWVEGGTDDREPAMTDFSTFVTAAIPFPIREWPLNITTGYDMRFLDGPDRPDLPPILYDAYIDFTWNLRITQRSTQVFSVAPGYYSDFEQTSGEAFRVTGKWMSAYEVVRHRITLITGTIYLGRDDRKMLPIVGLLITPNDWIRFDAIFPSPRVSLRLQSSEFSEDWVYAGADFYGGQTWAIERDDGSIDRVTMLDTRAVLGFERRRGGGAGWHVEGGWVFDRQVRFHNDPSDDFRPDPTYYVRAGLTF